MKKTVLLISATMCMAGASAAVVLANSEDLSYVFETRADSPITYKHYNHIAPTDNEHGCVEFWVSCSDYSYFLERPTSGHIVEGGNITSNPSFDWNGMNILDERYIPSNNELKQWGMTPVLDAQNNQITYGLFPQTVVSDSSLISALDALDSSAIYKGTGYYYYKGNFYQNCLGDRCDSDSHFADGTTVQNGTKYWFTCEPISWIIMESSNSTYLVYSEKALHGGINWGYSNSDVYEQSQVREWLNGYGVHADVGFFQTALFGSDAYVRQMTFTLDDGSATLNDKVRLLTKSEASSSAYFANDTARKLVPTDWAAAHHVCFQNGSSSFTRWWLCEANGDTNNAWGVGLGGAVGNGGPKTASGSNDRAERPCITIEIPD